LEFAFLFANIAICPKIQNYSDRYQSMLKFFTRLEKTRNFLLFIFAVVMVLGLVLFYTPTRNEYQANLIHSQEAAASVSGDKITIGEVVLQKENMSQFMRGQTQPTKSVLDGLIDGRIRRVEAARLGLTASDKEVADEIRKQYKGTGEDERPFVQADYEAGVIERWGNIEAYEARVRDDISSKKLEAFLTSGVTVSEQEVLDDFQKKNTKFDLTYVPINATELAKTIAVSDQELKDYFEQNKQTYFINSPQKKIRYIFVNTSKMGERLKIDEAELHTEYDNLAPDKKVAGVMGQEIVLRIAKPEFDDRFRRRFLPRWQKATLRTRQAHLRAANFRAP